MAFGRNVLGVIGSSISVSADGAPRAKIGGVTLDWTRFTLVTGADVTLTDGVVAPIGSYYCRYGQVITQITGGEITTLTVTAGSGNITITVGGQTATVAYNANAATIQAALEALSTVGTGKVVVTGTGPFTLTFDTALGNLTTTATGATVATTSEGGVTGKYGPYDPAAVDGRATLARGKAFVVNRSVVSNDPHSDYPEAIDGGRIWLERVIQSGVATHTLAAGPTKAEFETVFPGFTYATF